MTLVLHRLALGFHFHSIDSLSLFRHPSDERKGIVL
jgi:hypothetical protein